MKKLPKWLIIGGAIFLLTICCLISVIVSDGKVSEQITDQKQIEAGVAQTMAANITSTPEITATPRPIAPPYSEIAEKVQTMTEAQWKAYLPTLAGNSVISWTGWVSNVNVKSGGRYELLVDMDSPEELFSTSDVHFDIPDDIALEFEIDQIVVFSGTIDHVMELLGSIVVYLKDVSLEN